jgi:hypothetical protein
MSSFAARSGRLASVVAMAIVGLVLYEPAQAELGASPSTFNDGLSVKLVQRQAGSSSATSTSTSGSSTGTSTYTVRETTLSSGTVVREYVSSAGTVFGVAWQGPIRPQLSNVLGTTYFSQFSQQVAATRTARSFHAPVSIETSTLHVQLAGHMGAHIGHAWLPQALPSGLSGADIK